MSLQINTGMSTFIRISALRWADLLAEYAMYVMMNYLTNVWNLSTTHAAGIVNIWNGMKPVLASVFAFFVDSFMGDFNMLVFSSITYIIGLGLLSMSTPAAFGPCHHYKVECIGHTQKVLLYSALPLIAVGKAGQKVSLPLFRDLKGGTKTKKKKKIFYYTVMVVALITGGLDVPYIMSWSIRFGIPTICYVVATLLFFTGIQDYERKKPTGSPLTTTMRVFVATARKISQPIPNPKELYNEDNAQSTNTLRFLDKAAIMLPEDQQLKRWKLCSVREVEDTKIIIRLMSVWLTFIMIGIVLSTGTTYFLEQADRMDPKLGKIKVLIPIFLLFYTATSEVFAYFYTMCSPNKKHAPQIGIATSMVFCVLCCITAAKVETLRLHRIRDHGLLDKPNEMIPMSIFVLLPQFMLLAAVNGVANKSMSAFFRDQTPKSMRKYLIYLNSGVLGLGRMASVLLVYVVGKVSERNQKPNWFQYTLNRSHLDRYYWVLAGLSAANLVVYIIVACLYKYKESPEGGEDESDGGKMEEDF